MKGREHVTQMLDALIETLVQGLRRHHGWVVALLLLVFFVAGLVSLVGDSVTFDETAHLPAGFTYLDRADFRLNPEHPPLAKAWAGLPVWIAGLGNPDYGSGAWRGRPLADGASRSGSSEWLFGYEFLNGPRGAAARRDPGVALVPARIAILILGLLLGLLVYLWSRELWGPGGALLSLFCYCLSPTLLAHARLVTTDLPNALGFTAALFAYWRFTRQPTFQRGWVFAGAMGIALMMKFSALLLGPIVAILSLLWIGQSSRDERRDRIRQTAWAAGGVLLCCFLGLWAVYGFRFAAAADPAYQLDWSVVETGSGLASTVVQTALTARLLPEAYLYGLAYFLGGAARRLAYLNGDQAIMGWWYYFPEALLLKTPPSTLLMLGWVGLLARRLGRLTSPKALHLAVPILIYLGISMGSNLNIGHRHLVAVYPLLFVLLGRLAPLVASSRARQVALTVLLAGSIGSFMLASPGYLSYFNVLAGGPSGGPRYLLDSNIDWGQDLKRLRSYMDRESLSTVYLAYFGTADPEAYGIRFRKIHRVHDFDPQSTVERPGPGDIVAVSVNLAYGLYFDDDRDVAEYLGRRGQVTQEQVQRWLDARDGSHAEGREFPPLATWLLETGIITPEQRSAAVQSLTSSWLREVRENATPVHRAGDSILVYRVPASGRF